MRSTIAYLPLLLLNAILVKMAPATPGAGTDSSTSLVQANNLAPDFPSTALRFVNPFLQHTSNKKCNLTSPTPQSTQ